MTPFWLWVGTGCLASALCGFSAVRFGARRLWNAAGEQPREPAVVASASAVASPPVAREQPVRPTGVPARRRQLVTVPAREVTAPRGEPETAPAPTVPQPPTEKLVLWASQVKAGERKMSLATDGCRVTWNRTCKHGHPTWLVQLGYLDRPERQTP